MNWDPAEFKQLLIKKELNFGKTLQEAMTKLSIQYPELFPPDGKPKKSKMGNTAVTIDKIKFHSKKEAAYYEDLKLRLRSRDIKTFARQVTFVLNDAANGHKPVEYVADFVVWNNDGSVEIIDVKASEAFKTDVYKLKKRLFESSSGLSIKEVYEV